MRRTERANERCPRLRSAVRRVALGSDYGGSTLEMMATASYRQGCSRRPSGPVARRHHCTSKTPKGPTRPSIPQHVVLARPEALLEARRERRGSRPTLRRCGWLAISEMPDSVPAADDQRLQV
jgi:hypothetical protein